MVADLLAQLGAPFLIGTWLRGKKLAAGQTMISHGLGRVPLGYLVTRQSGAALWVSWDATHLVLSASTACVVDMWVW
jgi:hypothetical protein